MSAARMGKIPWNKGRKEDRNEVLDKLSNSKKGVVAYNKGQKMSYSQKIKLSCAQRKIKLSEFDELQTPIARAERNKFTDMKLHVKCFELNNYICSCCGLTDTILNAHHLNSWKFFPEQRFDLNNLVSLCETCHSDFHKIHGNGKATANTKTQYEEFKNNRLNHLIKKNIVIVAGVSGSGKSWVCKQLSNKYHYIPADKVNKSNVRSLIYNCQYNHILYDPTVHVTSFIRRNKDLFKIKLVVIIENEETIKSRLESRSGTFSDNIKRRINRMQKIKSAAEFSGTSIEVLKYLNQL
jgi:hypothetical protein